MTLTIGVDPGAEGALAVLDQSGWLLDVVDMPFDLVPIKRGKKTIQTKRVNPDVMAEWISSRVLGVGTRYEPRPTQAAVEQVGAMPNQGASSGFNFGTSYGKVLGVLAGCRIPTTVYRPQVWKKYLGITSDKETARARATEMWPERADWFKRKKDADRAEAALIAWYHWCLWVEGKAP